MVCSLWADVVYKAGESLLPTFPDREWCNGIVSRQNTVLQKKVIVIA
jgi:hypothetical protein